MTSHFVRINEKVEMIFMLSIQRSIALLLFMKNFEKSEKIVKIRFSTIMIYLDFRHLEVIIKPFCFSHFLNFPLSHSFTLCISLSNSIIMVNTKKKKKNCHIIATTYINSDKFRIHVLLIFILLQTYSYIFFCFSNEIFTNVDTFVARSLNPGTYNVLTPIIDTD
jgi:hypothetical protein